MKKKLLSIVLAIFLVIMITVSSIPFVSATVKTPNKPRSVLYISTYILQEHCISFKPSKGGAHGYNLLIKNANNKTYRNYYFSVNAAKSNTAFYKLGDYYDALFSKYASVLKEGNFYKICVRAFNVPNPKKYKSTGGVKPPKGTKYSGYAYTYGAESVTGAKAVKTSKGVKISWNKCKGASKYRLTIDFKDNKYIGKSYTLSGTSKAITKIKSVSFKGAKKVTVEISPIKVVGKKTYHATCTGPIDKMKYLKVK